MKIGVIDIGTNSILLLYNKEEELIDISEIVRLGESINETGLMNERAIQRAISTLEKFKRLYLGDANEVIVFGTEVLRKAKNAIAFIKLLKDRLGFDLRVLSPYEESFFSYLSVKYDENIPFEEFLIFDIGGGSTEIAEGTKRDFKGYISFPFGSVNLTETFVKHDPPKDEEILSMERFIREKIEGSIKEFDAKGPAIGIGGTVTNLASILYGHEEFCRDSIHGKRIGLSEIHSLIEMIRPLKKEKRARIKGIEEKRADIILAGLIILKVLLDLFIKEEIIVSTYGARYGILFKRIRDG